MNFSILAFLGLEKSQLNLSEKFVASLGGFIGISLISWISFQYTGAAGAALIVPSMGASAVLVFAVPQGKLSQPWPLLAGNLSSAFIGVLVYQSIPNLFLAAGVAVGVAIGVMHLINAIHPPGGATALAAVIGGPSIHDLGYQYVFSPVLLNVLIIFMIALAFNNLFPWRRYPASLNRFSSAPQTNTLLTKNTAIDRTLITETLKEMNIVIDTSTEDLQYLLSEVMGKMQQPATASLQITAGNFYTNGKSAAKWSIREVIEEVHSDIAEHDMIVFRVVEGPNLHKTDSCTRQAFLNWTASQVFRN